MTDNDIGLMDGAPRLQELQKLGPVRFELDRATLSLEYEPVMRVLVKYGADSIGWWTRNDKGMMVAHFEDSEAFSTTDPAKAHEYTRNMAKEYRKRLARRA